MNKKNTIIGSLLVVLSLLALVSCKKDVNCSNAEVCVYNNTGEAVHYRWGYSSADFEEILMPGETTCHNVGEIHITHSAFGNSSQTTFVGFYSEKGDIYEEITACHTTFELE